ncbi:MAG: YitT family protein, partial [Pseudomonadota bacterium]
MITGQTAGLAVLISYVTGWAFGPVFFVINLPFYALAWVRMGPRFTIKSFVAVGLLSVMKTILPLHISFATLTPLVGGLLAGAMAGLSLIVLFRHGASLGGIGVLALYLQDKTGFRAGWTQLIFDAVLFATALLVIGGLPIVYSLLGAIVTNLIIAVNHRP